MEGRRGGFDSETQWRVDLQSVLQETNLLSISAGDTGATIVNGASCKKYKKKKDLDDRKRQEENRTTHLQSICDSDDEKLAQKRSQKRRKSKKMMVVEVERIQRHLSESESYHADAEMGLNQDLDSDVEVVFDNLADVEMCPSGEASCTDDSSPSESRSKNRRDGDDGDDELSDVESSKSLNDYSRCPAMMLKTPAPTKHAQNISNIMETASWTHSKANKLPGLVARSIRSRVNSRRRQRLKTVPSFDVGENSDEQCDDYDQIMALPHLDRFFGKSTTPSCP